MRAIWRALRRTAMLFGDTFSAAAPAAPAVALALLLCMPGWSPSFAGALTFSPADGPLIYADWQEPSELPLPFRNHCRFDAFRGRFYCADHCGLDYQFYYCAPASFGCCRLGRGYCDWNGLLRCAP